MSQLLTAEFIQQAKKKLRFNSDKVVIENRVFRLFSRVTSAALLVCCGLVTLQQLVGEHIRCLTPPGDDVRPQAINQYCFIMSTFTIPSLYNKTVGVDNPHFGVGHYDKNRDEVKFHNYYQWVPFVLFFQAIIFMFPHQLWKMSEGGVLRAYCNFKIVDDFKMKQRFVVFDDDKNDSKEENLSKAGEYFIRNMDFNGHYALVYVICELLNCAVVVINLFLTDMFLGHEFLSYGPDVLSFLSKDPETRNDPMSRVFPKVTKCQFNKYGPSGGIINYDVMCVLALNIINEKIYTFLWFWFVILSIIGGLALVYRVWIFLSPSSRTRILCRRVLETDEASLKRLTQVLNYPNWFILKRLSDNINRLRFGELIRNIERHLLNSEHKKPDGNGNNDDKEEKKELIWKNS